jgi:hypothetical protein
MTQRRKEDLHVAGQTPLSGIATTHGQADAPITESRPLCCATSPNGRASRMTAISPAERPRGGSRLCANSLGRADHVDQLPTQRWTSQADRTGTPGAA